MSEIWTCGFYKNIATGSYVHLWTWGLAFGHKAFVKSIDNILITLIPIFYTLRLTYGHKSVAKRCQLYRSFKKHKKVNFEKFGH